MKSLFAAVREVIGLFVDDGSLALALIAWIAVIALVTAMLPPGGIWGAPVLAVGCLAILLANIRRSAR